MYRFVIVKQIWDQFYAFLRLIRIQNLIILLLLQYFGRIFLIDNQLSFIALVTEIPIFVLALSTILVAACGYIINDYYDIKIDMINKPNQVVIGKQINRRNAIIFHVILNFLAVFLSLILLSWRVAIFMSVCIFLLWIYSNYFKRTAFWGNLIISFLAFSALFILFLYYKSNLERILFFSTFAFLTTLIREIVKDIEDMRGDEIFDCKTLPIIWGVQKTKILVFIILILTLSLILGSNYFITAQLYIYLILFCLLPLLFVSYKLATADKKTDYNFINFCIKIIMIFGISGMIILKI
ncbi:MAG: prenyltransferase [Bacteroidetes bacterium]|nr:MAG: prenyltransferase [Bacteroidota bacterium]